MTTHDPPCLAMTDLELEQEMRERNRVSFEEAYTVWFYHFMSAEDAEIPVALAPLGWTAAEVVDEHKRRTMAGDVRHYVIYTPRCA